MSDEVVVNTFVKDGVTFEEWLGFSFQKATRGTDPQQQPKGGP